MSRLEDLFSLNSGVLSDEPTPSGGDAGQTIEPSSMATSLPLPAGKITQRIEVPAGTFH